MPKRTYGDRSRVVDAMVDAIALTSSLTAPSTFVSFLGHFGDRAKLHKAPEAIVQRVLKRGETALLYLRAGMALPAPQEDGEYPSMPEVATASDGREDEVHEDHYGEDFLDELEPYEEDQRSEPGPQSEPVDVDDDTPRFDSAKGMGDTGHRASGVRRLLSRSADRLLEKTKEQPDFMWEEWSPKFLGGRKCIIVATWCFRTVDFKWNLGGKLLENGRMIHELGNNHLIYHQGARAAYSRYYKTTLHVPEDVEESKFKGKSYPAEATLYLWLLRPGHHYKFWLNEVLPGGDPRGVDILRRFYPQKKDQVDDVL